MGVYSLRPDAIARALKCFAPAGVTSALVFPYFGTATMRMRLYPPPEGQKYTQPAGTTSSLYLLPWPELAWWDPTRPLLVVEGEKKCACLAQHGHAAIGLAGIWNWSDRQSRHGLAILDAFAQPGREVWLVVDSDTWPREQLRQAVFGC